MENKEIIQDVQMENVAGGMRGPVVRTCIRCGKIHFNYFGLCDQCKQETEIASKENGAYGCW